MSDSSGILRVSATHNMGSFGVSGGLYSGDVSRALTRGPRPMTRTQIAWAQADGRSRPPRFTGRWGDRYYYRGREWTGPTNMLGVRA
jgi:hypothetical protein